MNCPECHTPMTCLGNVDGIVLTSNPPQWTDTYVCDSCKIKQTKHVSGQPTVYHDLSGYRDVNTFTCVFSAQLPNFSFGQIGQ